LIKLENNNIGDLSINYYVSDATWMSNGGSGDDIYLYKFGRGYIKDWLSFRNGPVFAMTTT